MLGRLSAEKAFSHRISNRMTIPQGRFISIKYFDFYKNKLSLKAKFIYRILVWTLTIEI